MALLYSCVNDNETLVDKSDNRTINNDSIIVFQERDASLPTHPRSMNWGKLLGSRTSSEFTGNSDALLGYGYKASDGGIGNANNTTFRILSLSKIKEISSEYFESMSPKYFDEEHFSFSSYETYEEKIRTTKKITSGFKIGIKIFSIGAKKTIDKTFSSHITSSKNATYGKLDMLYVNKTFKLQTLASSRKRFAMECMSPIFLEGLYSSTMGDIIDHFGEFVITGYATGGKATAYFAAIDASGSSATIRETKMDKDIGLSFSWEKSDSLKGNYNFGNSNYKADSTSYNYKDLQANLTLYGGNPHNMGLSNATKISELNIDLGPWVTSLSDDSKYTMIDFTENGVYPISEFIFEENYKRRFDDTAIGVLQSSNILSTPYIEIARVFERYSSDGEALYDIAAVLITRNDDRIILRSNDASSLTDAQLKQFDNAQVFSEKAKEIANAKKGFYKLGIRSNSSKFLFPAFGNPLCIDIKKFDENNVKIVYNGKTGVTYLCDTVNKVAFSCMIDYDDSVLGDYGIYDWYDSMSETSSVSISRLLNNYTIIGL